MLCVWDFSFNYNVDLNSPATVKSAKPAKLEQAHEREKENVSPAKQLLALICRIQVPQKQRKEEENPNKIVK